MPEFHYRAMQGTGRLAEGVVLAETESAAAAQLRVQGYLPLHIARRREARPLRFPFPNRRLRADDRVVFARQLATLVRAGVPLDRSLALCRDLADKKALREIVESVLSQLRYGNSLADSLTATGRFFPPLYIAMVRAGEASGTLPLVLDRLVEFEEFSQELRNYLLSALIYPTLLLVVGGTAIAVLLGYVIPRFAQIFEEAGRALPLSTWVLLQIGKTLQHYGWLLGVLLVLAVWGGRRWLQTETGRSRWDEKTLRVPILGSVLLKLEIARFAKTLGTLLAQNVPIVTALRLTQGVLGNRVLAKSVDPLILGLKRGQGLSTPLAQAGLFPPLAIQLVTVGEHTGRLDAMLLQVAEVYDREVRTGIKRLVALVEPSIILVMGLIVGAIVISTLLAIVSVNEVPF